MAHCNALLVHCIDFRFIGAVRSKMEQEGLLGNCDVFSCAGAALALVGKESEDVRFAMKQIEISRTLHGVGEVILMNHADCGAYKQEWNFHSQEQELGVHSGHLERAAVMIQQKYPGVRVRKVFAVLDGGGGVKFMDL